MALLMSSIWLYSSKSLEYGHTAVHLIHGEGDAASQPGCWVSLVLLQIQPLWRVHLNQIKINFVSHSNLLTWRTSSLSKQLLSSSWPFWIWSNPGLPPSLYSKLILVGFVDPPSSLRRLYFGHILIGKSYVIEQQ